MYATDQNRLTEAFALFFDSFYVPEKKLFREAIGKRKKGDPEFAYNWSFGALLASFAALLESGAVTDHPLREFWETTLLYSNDRYLTFHQGLLGYDSYIDQEKPARYYDDNAWIGLASLRIFEQTGNSMWMQRAITAFEFVRDGWDSSSDGIFWRESPRVSLHVCSTGPGALLAGQLYGHTHVEDHLDCARRWFAWTLRLRDSDGVFQDNFNPQTGVIESKKFTYNQGTPLQTALVLYEATQNAMYRTEAQSILEAARYFVTPSSQTTDKASLPKLPPTIWFNAVLLRAVTVAKQMGMQTSLLEEAYDHELAIAWDNKISNQPLVARTSPENVEGRISLLDAAGTMEIAALRARKILK